MDIEQKIALSRQPIQFFKQGIFAKLYNESLYVACLHYQINLKPSVNYIKQLDQIVVSGGLPLKSILHYFPQAKPTDYGYQLAEHFDCSGYQTWFNYHCQLASNASYSSYSTFYPSTELTFEQRRFLTLWRSKKYTSEINERFIISLKKHFNL